MKLRRILITATVFALAAAIGASSATAQSQGLRATIPFEFHAAGQVFPAGNYLLVQVAPGAVKLQNVNKGGGVFIATGRESQRMGDNSWYLFNQYGNKHFLAGAYWSGSSVSLKIEKSRAENEVARIAARQTPVQIAAR